MGHVTSISGGGEYVDQIDDTTPTYLEAVPLEGGGCVSVCRLGDMYAVVLDSVVTASVALRREDARKIATRLLDATQQDDPKRAS